MAHRIGGFLLMLLMVYAGGCGEDDVHIYRVAKEKSPMSAGMPTVNAEAPFAGTMPMGGPMQQSGAAEASAEDISWKIPRSWKEQPASGMRRASFVVPGSGGENADMSVVVFPGSAGGDLANINRWRGQVGLEPWDEGTLNRSVQHVKTKAGNVLIVDFVGIDQKGDPSRKVRMLGAILSAQDKTWFFKMIGPESVVRSAKPSFMEFVRSIHFGAT